MGLFGGSKTKKSTTNTDNSVTNAGEYAGASNINQSRNDIDKSQGDFANWQGGDLDQSRTDNDYDYSQRHETDIEQGDMANNTGTINITDGGSFKMVSNAMEEIGGFASDTVDRSLDTVDDAISASNKTALEAIESANHSADLVNEFAGETVGDVLEYAGDTNRRTSETAVEFLNKSISGFNDQNEDLLKAVGAQNTLLAETLGEGFAAANAANSALMQQTTRSNVELAQMTATNGQSVIASSAVEMVKIIGTALAVSVGCYAIARAAR